MPYNTNHMKIAVQLQCIRAIGLLIQLAIEVKGEQRSSEIDTRTFSWRINWIGRPDSHSYKIFLLKLLKFISCNLLLVIPGFLNIIMIFTGLKITSWILNFFHFSAEVKLSICVIYFRWIAYLYLKFTVCNPFYIL